MADKKFIRDLNSLIRFPHRKRLKTADMRAGIDGGTGIAEEGQDEVVVPDYEYAVQARNTSGNEQIFIFDKAGVYNRTITGAPADPDAFSVGFGVDGDVYTNTDHDIYKNTTIIASNGSGEVAIYDYHGIVVDDVADRLVIPWLGSVGDKFTAAYPYIYKLSDMSLLYSSAYSEITSSINIQSDTNGVELVTIGYNSSNDRIVEVHDLSTGAFVRKTNLGQLWSDFPEAVAVNSTHVFVCFWQSGKQVIRRYLLSDLSFVDIYAQTTAEGTSYGMSATDYELAFCNYDAQKLNVVKLPDDSLTEYAISANAGPCCVRMREV